MTREIKFRGKRIDSAKEWIYGYVIKEPNGTYWMDHYPGGIRHTVQINPETLGQLNNSLSKKARMEIYEDDIIRHDLRACGDEPESYNHKEQVSIEHGYYFYYNIRLLGNIHENPELV